MRCETIATEIPPSTLLLGFIMWYDSSSWLFKFVEGFLRVGVGALTLLGDLSIGKNQGTSHTILITISRHIIFIVICKFNMKTKSFSCTTNVCAKNTFVILFKLKIR